VEGGGWNLASGGGGTNELSVTPVWEKRYKMIFSGEMMI